MTIRGASDPYSALRARSVRCGEVVDGRPAHGSGEYNVVRPAVLIIPRTGGDRAVVAPTSGARSRPTSEARPERRRRRAVRKC